MDKRSTEEKKVLLAGDNILVDTVAVCLLQAGYAVHLCTTNQEERASSIWDHFSDMGINNAAETMYREKLVLSVIGEVSGGFDIAIILTKEDPATKKMLIQQVEEIVAQHIIIAVNFESFDLQELQQDTQYPARIIGLNWTEPAHTTRFLEIISNAVVDKELADQFVARANTWNKDPYIVNGISIRSRMMGAMVREAFYLVDHGYASIEDIDRACRNDPGYYLPFAGNCRYMDLMGTYGYGVVMESLNPELSNEQRIPVFFNKIIDSGGRGMENKQGLYRYTTEEIDLWKKITREFSYKIASIIDRYPFNHVKPEPE